MSDYALTALEEIKKARQEKTQHLKMLMRRTRQNLRSMSSLIQFKVSDQGDTKGSN